MDDALMGTLAWCKQSGGRLSASEKEALARNAALLQAEIIFDEFRTHLGLLSPGMIDMDILAPPETTLTRDADEFARSLYGDVIWNHCVRTYYFGALVAAHDGLTFDREIFYAAAICHDAGTNQEKAGPVSASLATSDFRGAGSAHALQRRILHEGPYGSDLPRPAR